LWAHRSQLWALSTELSDEDAVLLDPAATALAALLRTETPETHRTLVVGGGTIGLLVALLHRALARPGECVLVVRHAFQEQLALEFGLAVIRIRGEREFRDWASTEGIGSRRVMGYGHVFDGVFDRVIDAAGSDTSFRWALHAVRAGGRLVLVSAPARLRLDPTPLWYREIQVHGINVYGPVPWEGEQAHPYAVLLEVLARGDLDWRRLVTHVVPLSDWVVGVSKALRRGGEPAIKVAFRP
jgi:threonine dehydrogenase-like Zn-dependent dehydrogenase